jgi:hypothetical protein
MRSKCIFSAIALTLSLHSFATGIDQLMVEFSGSDWQSVYDAKLKLESMQEAALPNIMALLDQGKSNKLTNTSDLIYPGASKFYGHGMIVDYDIDKLDIRAGWLLEEITFQNFGFSVIHDRDENLMINIRQNFKEFLTQKNMDKFDKMSPDELREEMKKMAIKKAKDWWANESTDWKRLSGIIDALHSDDIRRQILALKYLKSGESPCNGLSIEAYLDELKGRITYLSKSKINRISEYSIYIINDSDFEFIRIKN